jgi:hypothetical protein
MWRLGDPCRIFWHISSSFGESPGDIFPSMLPVICLFLCSAITNSGLSQFMLFLVLSFTSHISAGCPRVSLETIFDSKQPKLEPKLVSALSENKRLFRLFRFYTETESFDVSIERNKQTTNPNSLVGSIFCYFFQKIYGFLVFSVSSVCLKQFCFFRLFRYRFETPKQTEFFFVCFKNTLSCPKYLPHKGTFPRKF